MFLELKQITCVTGYGHVIAERFSNATVVREQEGFVKLEVGQSSTPQNETVFVFIYWTSKDAYLSWKKSDAHLSGHKNRTKDENVLDHKSTGIELQS